MHTHPLPVVILGSENKDESVNTSFRALDAGALTVLTLPDSSDVAQYRRKAESVCKSMQLMAEVKVVRRWDSNRFQKLEKTEELEALPRPHPIDIVVIGASAGGTKALQSVFAGLPSSFSAPILVVQHIAQGYVNGLVRWLSEQCTLRVAVAEDGMTPAPGWIYVAPDDHHLTVDTNRRILLTDEESKNGFRPAIARLFSSVCHVYGANSAAVLLSGMGNDGAAEMRSLFDAGACTIAQDKETSLIHGIPGEAIKLSAARYVLPVQEIGRMLNRLVHNGTQVAQTAYDAHRTA